MLTNLVLAKNIKAQRGELDALLEKDADFKAREDELLADIEAAQTKEEREAVEAAVADYDKELAAHEAAKAKLSGDIEALEKELAELEKPIPAPAKTGAENKNERMINPMIQTMNSNVLPGLAAIRSLPMNCRAFDSLPQAHAQSILADDKVKTFLANVRAMRGAHASVTGADFAIPVNILPIINENRYRYSKLVNRVLVRNVRGETRQPVGGLTPPAIWEDCCDAINELDFAYSMIEVTCHKVGGYVLICNSLIEETDIDLLADLIEMVLNILLLIF